MDFRFAAFNVALYRDRAGQLLADLAAPHDPQACTVAEIIQRVRPDVLVLNEFDYDAEGTALRLFQRHYLAIGQHGRAPIHYPYRQAFPANTGLSSGVDLDGDGVLTLPHDAFGYGAFPGQYAFALLSRYPIDRARTRTFQRWLWQDLPDARLPYGYYSTHAASVLRLSSKNHIDAPITLPTGVVHVLACHPTPPVFDGIEDRNGWRNYDEIRLFAEYIDPARGAYLADGAGKRGGLAAGARFVIMGDLNADPLAGESIAGASQQLLHHPLLNAAVATGDLMPTSAGGRAFAAATGHPQPASVTARFNGGLRVDYVLPSANLTALGSGVFWPPLGDPLHRLVAAAGPGSDHRLVWVDVRLPFSNASALKGFLRG